ncbi:connectin-like [Rhipicephalus sanguineus]|uniref:connectin-like n=1 Tax=Rhipicephalus sanguineus TaxID=34632 RepID=UPI0018956A61|nr:connectin-like [Rhipicephalus sanguineus]
MYPQISLLAAVCFTAFIRYVTPEELVPDLCNLIDQPMYCRCDTSDLAEEVTDVTCYVGRKLPPDHIVFESFKRQPAITALAFNAFGGEYRLGFVPTQALRHTPDLERLKVSQAELGDLKPHAFHNLSRLAVLSLDSNEITSLDADAIADLPRLKKLELADNKLIRLRAGSLKNLPSLTQLFLERNQLELVDDGAFEDLGALRELELSDNVIQKLSEQSFRGLRRVARLDLFRNKLTRLEARVFSGMPQLAELDLKYNELSEVDPLAFEGLPQLTVLYMSYNRLRVLPAHMFRGAPNLVSVDLSQNQLLTLTWRTIQDLAKIDAESFDMSLTGNKFSCDCRLSWILHLENATRNAKFRRELRHVKCEFENVSAAPANMTANKVVRLSLKQLRCAEDYERPALGQEATTLPPERRPHVADDDEADATGGLGHSDEFSSDTRPSQHESRGEVSPMTNDVEVILNQRKSIENDSSASSTRTNAIGSANNCHLAESTLVSFLLVLCAIASNCYR